MEQNDIDRPYHPTSQSALRAAPASAATVLRQNLTTYFNKSELRDLCFDLGVDYENLPDHTKSDTARELVAYMERVGRTVELVALCQKLRSHVDWSGGERRTPVVPNPVEGADLQRDHFALDLMREAAERIFEAPARTRSAVNPSAELVALIERGLHFQRLHERSRAEAYYRQALDLCRQLSYHPGEIEVLGNIGLLYSADDPEAALGYFQQALELAETLDSRLGIALQLIRIGSIMLHKQPVHVNKLFQRALTLFTAEGAVAGQAQAWIGIGLCELQRGHTAKAHAALTRAHTLFKQIGAADAEIVQQQLATLLEGL